MSNLNEFHPAVARPQHGRVAPNSKSKPETETFHPTVSHIGQQLKERQEEVCFNEGDFKYQKATATDTRIHVTSFYLQGEDHFSKCVHLFVFRFLSTKLSRLLWHDRAGVGKKKITLAGGTPFWTSTGEHIENNFSRLKGNFLVVSLLIHSNVYQKNIYQMMSNVQCIAIFLVYKDWRHIYFDIQIC